MKPTSKTAALAALCLVALAWPAAALTNDHGIVVFTQADALAGGVTPGDAPGFPVTISVPGSYRLGSTLTVTTEANGIDVPAAEVTIDFAGHRLIGSSIGFEGINGTQRALTVKNGTIRAFTGNGIRATGVDLVVDGMNLAQNGSPGQAGGILSTGGGDWIVNSRFTGNLRAGVVCDVRCYIRNNTVNGNGSFQVQVDDRSMVQKNLMSGDGGPSTFPVYVPDGKAGWGDNAMNNFGGSSQGDLLLMSPNSCAPAGC